jgi:hypothetical protein
MSLPSPKVCKVICKLHAVMLGSDKAPEREAARGKLERLLQKHGCTWNDVAAIIAAVYADDNVGDDAPPPPPDQPADQSGPHINVFNLVHELVRRHIYVAPEECTAIALWILHTWIYRRFRHSPRLALISPVRGCGKTTTIALIEQLVPNPWRADHVSPASIYRQRPLPVFLLDEFDQANLRNNDVLKRVLHGGWEVGGAASLVIDGRSQLLKTYAPVAMAAIGAHSLSLQLLDRSIVINMHKPPPDVPIDRLDTFSSQFTVTRKLILQWAQTVQLDENPDVAGLPHRLADTWRAIFSVADSLSAGPEARAAATKLKANRADVDPSVALLGDIRLVLRQRGVDRIASMDLVAALHELNDYWADWDDGHPGRKLTQMYLAHLLRAFHIRSKSIQWAANSRRVSRKGYTRDQFQDAWRRYCPEDGTAAQPKKTIRLVGS